MPMKLDIITENSLRAAMLASCLVIAVVAGCQSPNLSPASRPANTESLGSRARMRAGQLTEQAKVDFRAGHRDSAMKSLKEAVGLDPTSGTAKHLLGLVYFEKGDLYNAALQLDAATRLLSDRYEPCYNLGKVLEAGGQYEQAIRSYERSLGRRVDHLQSIENLARVRIKAGYRDQETLRLLTRCIDREKRPEWNAWLRRESDLLNAGLAQSGKSPSLPREKSSAQTQHAN